jgi:peptidoglycan hydrolase-like protein with peptidoglycan-binding domain
MKITSRQLRQIIKEELARSGFGRLREGAGDTAKDMLYLFDMPQFDKDALQVDKELEDILNNTRVIKMGDKGQVVKVIQALVKGKLFQSLENKSAVSFTKSPGGELEIQRSINALGEPDGDFGNNTKNAVMTLQKVAISAATSAGRAKASASELPTVDGKVGRQTLTFLLGLQGASVTGQLRKAEPVEQKEDMLSKSKLIAALNDPATAKRISDVIKMTPGQLKALAEMIGDEDPHPKSWWIEYFQFNSADPDADIDMIALQNALDQVSGKQEPGDIGPARSSVASKADAPMNEGRDLTARLMNRWLK